MSGLFNMDGAFYKYGTLVADIMILTVLWLLLCIPIVTAGAATTAVFYVTTKRVNKKDTYIWKSFWSSFKTNFKSATILWMMILLFFIIAIVNISNVGVFGSAAGIFFALEIVLMVETLMVSIYIFPMLSRFEMGKMQLIKSAFIMANKHIITTISCIGLMVGCLLATWQWNIMVFLGMGTYAYLSSMLLTKVFKKYRPELDENFVYDDIEESKRAMRALEGINDSNMQTHNAEADVNTSDAKE